MESAPPSSLAVPVVAQDLMSRPSRRYTSALTEASPEPPEKQ
jgi:hypothetical protein